MLASSRTMRGRVAVVTTIAKTAKLATVALTIVLAGALLSTGAARAAESGSEFDGTDWEDASARDPIERVNRGFFWFNDTLDVYAMAPIARGWDWLAPDPLQQSITNFFANLRFPVNMANNVLQGKFDGGAITTGRFVINSTIGLAGLFDPAKRWGIMPQPEDFGQTLGRWGTPPGPYLVLPLVGPLNIRDGGGTIVDWGFSVMPLFVNSWILLGGNAVNTVNTRAEFLQEVDDAKAASLDYYVFVRNAYFQRRQALIRDLDPDQLAPTEENIYDDSWDDEASE